MTKSSSNKGLAFFFTCIHLFFLFHLSKSIDSVCIWILVGITPFYFLLPFEKTKLKLSNTILNSIFFFLGCISTIFLQHWILNVVICASAIGYIGVRVSEKIKFIKPFTPAIYAGCFAGMANVAYFNTDTLPWTTVVLIASIVGGIILSAFEKSLIGFGGKLGSIGFSAVFIVSILNLDAVTGMEIAPVPLISYIEVLTTIGVAFLGSISTYLLSIKKSWNPIKSSAFLGFIAASALYIGQVLTIGSFYHHFGLLSFVFFGSTFIGMTSPQVFKIGKLLVASLIFSFLFLVFNHSFKSIGGALGTTACISVIFVHLVSTLNRLIKK